MITRLRDVRERREVLVCEGDRHAAFTDGRCHAFDRIVAHVADREETRHALFEEERIQRERPRRKILSRKDVAARIARDRGR